MLPRGLDARQVIFLVGVSPNMMRAIEGGCSAPRLSAIRRLAEALHIRAEDVRWPGDVLGHLREMRE